MADETTHIFTFVIDKADDSAPNQYSLQLYEAAVSRRSKQPLGTLIEDHVFTWANAITPTGVRDDYKAFGQRLYQCVFSPEIVARLQQAESDRQRITRLVFEVHPTELRSLPWEALHNGSSLLSVSRRTPFVRRLPEITHEKYASIVGALNILVLAAAPTDQRDLKIEITLQEIQKLNQEMQAAKPRQRKLEFTTVAHATFRDLKSELEQKAYHILCLVGHGTQSEFYFDDGSKFTPQERERGTSDPIAMSKLVTQLEGSQIRLIILLGCETASASPVFDPNLLNLTEALAQNQPVFPAVMGMQTPIMIRNLERFLVDFLRLIGNENTIDIALSQARKTLIRGADDISSDTIAPIVYLQDSRGELFQRAFDRQYWGLVAAVALVVLLAIGIGVQTVVGFINDRIQENQANARVAQEREDQLQTRAYMVQHQTIPSAGLASQGVIAFGSAWFATEQNVQKVSLLDASVEIFNIGPGAKKPVFDGTYLWITVGSGVIRLDPMNKNEITSFPIGFQPNLPLVVGDNVWIEASADKTLTRINRITGQTEQVMRNFDMSTVFKSQNAVWVILEDELVRFSSNSKPETFSFEMDILQAVSVKNSVLVLLDNGTLVQVNEATLEINSIDQKARLIFPSDDGYWILDQGERFVLQLSVDSGEIIARYPSEGPPLSLFHSPGRLWILNKKYQIEFYDAHTRMRTNVIKDASIEDVNNILWDLNINQSEDAYVNVETKPVVFSGVQQIAAITGIYQIVLFDTNTKTQITKLSDISTSAFLEAIYDKETIWFLDPTTGAITRVAQDNGDIIRQFTPCTRAQNLLLDDINFWVSCPVAQNILITPIDMYYILTPSAQADTMAQSPVVIDDALWLIQENTGQVIVYDETKPVLIENLPKHLLPIQTDQTDESEGKFIWTANSINLFQLSRESSESSLNLGIPVSYSIRVRSAIVGGEIISFRYISGRIWVLHTSLEDLGNSPNVSIFNSTTMGLVKQITLDGIPTGLTVTNKDVWVGASEFNEGWLYRFDPQTGEQLGNYDLPQTEYAPWPGERIDSKLWFIAGAPPIGRAGSIFLESSNQTYTPGLMSFDLNSYTWDKIYSIPPSPMRPEVDSPFLWINTSVTPILTEQSGPNEGNIFAVDTRDGTIFGPWEPCADTMTPYVSGRFIWVGCFAPDTDLWAFDRTSPAPIHQYPEVGSRPWPPVELDGLIWMTFRDTRNVAIFDAQTGFLLQNYLLSESPGVPFVYQGKVWVHLANGVLQTLHFETRGSYESADMVK